MAEQTTPPAEDDGKFSIGERFALRVAISVIASNIGVGAGVFLVEAHPGFWRGWSKAVFYGVTLIVFAAVWAGLDRFIPWLTGYIWRRTR